MTDAVTVHTTTSQDGTTIAYERHGQGGAVVLIGGAFNDRGTVRDLALALAPHVSAYVYDRRGRGHSSDTAPYAVEREIEDLEAVIAAAGGTAGVFGHSSGAGLAVLAAARGTAIAKVAAYEPPYRRGDNAELKQRVAAAVDAGDRGEAVRLFLTLAVGLSEDVIPMIQASRDWQGMTDIAHTLPYDLAVMGDGAVPPAVGQMAVPLLAMSGGASPAWFTEAARRLVAAVPGARFLTIDGEDHAVLQRPAALVAPLVDFFS